MSQPSRRHQNDILSNGNLDLSLIAIGSNVTSLLGNPEDLVLGAVTSLPSDSIRLIAISSLYTTPSFPAGSGPDFVNAAAVIESDLSAHELLLRLHEVEHNFGRSRDVRWGARTIDMDLLACGSSVFPDVETVRKWQDMPLEEQMTVAPSELILPHPRMQDRGFVLVPLAEIAPDWEHPILHRSVSQMLDALPDREKAPIRRLSSANLG
ncbi:2-amino-4-hydroxy-6-hydroxymethyldihydropteridine diphosphokinase [Actibacterium lipolyticum]|uniref:2-amino-4-hydroxy-6-hydroxymethyldihydropteridine pyrophosphokinase n=1 Tax=Actibacterium lipolyticum TaxID=1524263 RepID=A0A238JKS8_9RHOB|nr:2-amino-4-hydroxy-6-hydroxymethyldihydropteridine diphosphokinase [Actibacterium lipolyticum]SMX30814.1 2-amino-4-hydroxy-6-hydroxymethyldihydropteridinepyrophosphokinase [Actibacterium lipolyticum]